MSKKELKREYVNTSLGRVQLKPLVKVEMPNSVLEKIKYLCKEIPKVEWSGIIFYTTEGSIKDIANFRIKLKDIYLMDKGSSGYTEYELDESIIDYRMSKPESFNWKMGHIHSHNTMKTFFSGVDLSELNDNSELHNYYFSLIVNNFMDFTAKVAFRGLIKHDISELSYNAKDEEGREYPIAKEKIEIIKEKMFMYDCDITSPKEDISVSKEFSNRVSFIIKAAKKKVESFKKAWNGKTHHPGKEFQSKGFTGAGWGNNFTNRSIAERMEIAERLEDEKNSPQNETEDLLLSLFRYGNENDIPNDSLEMVFEEIDKSGINPNDLAQGFIKMFPTVFDRFYEDFSNADVDFFLAVVDDCINLLKEEYLGFFDFLEPLIGGLERLHYNVSKSEVEYGQV